MDGLPHISTLTSSGRALGTFTTLYHLVELLLPEYMFKSHLDRPAGTAVLFC
jgi:hypothetical protein